MTTSTSSRNLTTMNTCGVRLALYKHQPPHLPKPRYKRTGIHIGINRSFFTIEFTQELIPLYPLGSMSSHKRFCNRAVCSTNDSSFDQFQDDVARKISDDFADILVIFGSYHCRYIERERSLPAHMPKHSRPTRVRWRMSNCSESHRPRSAPIARLADHIHTDKFGCVLSPDSKHPWAVSVNGEIVQTASQ